jgi:hypothetical protein
MELDLGVDRIILKWILGKYYRRVWITKPVDEQQF